MPYLIVKRKGPRPYKIVRKADHKVVGSSVTRKNAIGSIAHRMEAEKKTAKKRKKK